MKAPHNTYTQSPRSLMLVRPASFGFNDQTADSNSFQQQALLSTSHALAEFDRMVDVLISHDIDVHVFDDTKEPVKPDAIFPNNWISLHHNGKVILYPMLAANRRAERRMDIVDSLRENFVIEEVIDLSHAESEGRYLEGTGSMVFDHAGKIIYACRSPRTDVQLLAHAGSLLSYDVKLFSAVNEKGTAIYHTNVMMSIGDRFAVVCLDAVHADEDQEMLLAGLSDTGHQVIAISYDQMNAFAGNCFEVRTRQGEPVLLLSQQALHTLLPGQANALSAKAELLAFDARTIETLGGGSVRCMVAGIHLPLRGH